MSDDDDEDDAGEGDDEGDNISASKGFQLAWFCYRGHRLARQA